MPAKLIRDPSLEAWRRTSLGWPAGVALLVVVILLAFWGWTAGSDARVLGRMPPAERARLFQLTRDDAEVLCATPDLEDRCRAQVDLLSKFPECGTECQAFVARHRPRAAR
jgi:hypothetical protein